MIADVLRLQCLVARQDPDLDDFAGHRMRLADDFAVDDIGMEAHDVLDFARVNIEAGYEDHAFDASDDKPVSILIEGRKVTAFHPAITGEVPGGFLGIPPVALHHLGAADPKLTRCMGCENFTTLGIDKFQFRFGNGFAHAADAVGVRWIEAGHRRSLGHAETFQQGFPGDVLPLPRDLGIEFHAAGDRETQPRKIHRAKVVHAQKAIK